MATHDKLRQVGFHPDQEPRSELTKEEIVKIFAAIFGASAASASLFYLGADLLLETREERVLKEPLPPIVYEQPLKVYFDMFTGNYVDENGTLLSKDQIPVGLNGIKVGPETEQVFMNGIYTTVYRVVPQN